MASSKIHFWELLAQWEGKPFSGLNDNNLTGKELRIHWKLSPLSETQFHSKVGTCAAGIKKIKVQREFQPQTLWWQITFFFFLLHTRLQMSCWLLSMVDAKLLENGGRPLPCLFQFSVLRSLIWTLLFHCSFYCSLEALSNMGAWPQTSLGFLVLSLAFWRAMTQNVSCEQQLGHYNTNWICPPFPSTQDVTYSTM